MTNNNITPLETGEPRSERLGGVRGGSRKTRFYREQLQGSPGKWFVWKKNSPHASDTSGALRTLTGINILTGVDRTTLDYEATAQKQNDGSYTTFVRFTGGAKVETQAVNFDPLNEGVVVNN